MGYDARLRVGILGGAGFIGSRLARQLVTAGHQVRVGDIVAFDGPGVDSVLCDVTQIDDVKRFVGDLDIVYNLAAEHRDDVWPLERYGRVNVLGARNLCEAARCSEVRAIRFTSSVAVYGFCGRPADESSPCMPFNEYGRTKWQAEEVYRAWADEHPSRSLVIVRPTVVFGEGNRGNVYNLAKQVSSGLFVMIGNGQNRKSVAYVENVVAFLIHVLRADQGVHLFNYADGPDLDMSALVSLIRRSLGRPLKTGPRLPYALGLAVGVACDAVARVSRSPLPVSAVRVRKFCADSQIVGTRAFETGFQPVCTLQEGLERFLASEFERGADVARFEVRR